jgi:hypothetical protein
MSLCMQFVICVALFYTSADGICASLCKYVSLSKKLERLHRIWNMHTILVGS